MKGNCKKKSQGNLRFMDSITKAKIIQDLPLPNLLDLGGEIPYNIGSVKESRGENLGKAGISEDTWVVMETLKIGTSMEMFYNSFATTFLSFFYIIEFAAIWPLWAELRKLREPIIISPKYFEKREQNQNQRSFKVPVKVYTLKISRNSSGGRGRKHLINQSS